VNIGPAGMGYGDLPSSIVNGMQASTVIGNVGFFTKALNYPSGTYTIRFNAPNPSAIQVTVGGFFGGLTNAQVSGNSYTAQVTLNHDRGDPLAGSGEIDLNGASAANPVTNFTLTRPGGVMGGLTPQFQQYLNNYQAVRWMNNNDINNNVRVLSASDMMPSGQNFGAGGAGWGNFGNSYDDIITWANGQQNLKKVWINIPSAADDSFVKAVADKFATKLHSDKAVVVEYSNEPWNFFFTHSGLVINARAQKDSRVTNSGDVYSATGQEYGLTAAHIMQIFKQEFTANGADPTRAQGFLNSQGANQWFVEQSKSAINRIFGAGSVAKLFYYQGISFYPTDNLDSYSSTNQLVSALYTDLNRQKTYLANDIESARKDGLHEAIYEWGINGFLTKGVVTQAGLDAFRADPRSKQWTIDEYNATVGPLTANDGSRQQLGADDMVMEFTVAGDGWSAQVNPSGPKELEQQGIEAIAANH
jgi:hypothetical protein